MTPLFAVGQPVWVWGYNQQAWVAGCLTNVKNGLYCYWIAFPPIAGQRRVFATPFWKYEIVFPVPRLWQLQFDFLLFYQHYLQPSLGVRL